MMIVEQSVECELVGETESTRRKPTPVLLFPPQIPYDLTRARTRAAAYGSRRINAWAMGLLVLCPYWPCSETYIDMNSHILLTFAPKMEVIFTCETSAALPISTGFRDRKTRLNMCSTDTTHLDLSLTERRENLTMFCSCNLTWICLV
jgi:hypothetical protein